MTDQAIPRPALDTPSVVLRACARHGASLGLNPALRVQLKVEHLGGAIPWAKGLGRTHPQPGAVTIEPSAERTIFHDYPESGRDLIYERGSILADQVLHTGYRKTFRGLRKFRRWSPSDVAYFFGYAMVDYLALPFSLVGRTPVAAGRCQDRRRTLDFLSYTWPAGADTHGGRQTFYFDAEGLLIRHDYHADILGRGCYGAHYSEDYIEVGGLLIARSRTVFARVGRCVTPVVVLRARFSDIEAHIVSDVLNHLTEHGGPESVAIGP